MSDYYSDDLFESSQPSYQGPGDSGQCPNENSNWLPPRQLALVKHGHRYVFNYQPGRESELLERLTDMAHDPDCSLGMFDAAVLSHQVGRCLSQQIEQLLKR